MMRGQRNTIDAGKPVGEDQNADGRPYFVAVPKETMPVSVQRLKCQVNAVMGVMAVQM